MLLIPGCATRGRTALMFQGILLGLFLSGAARWGWQLLLRQQTLCDVMTLEEILFLRS